MMGLTESGTIGVIGAGTMGAGIAQVAAQSGYSVLLYDVDKSVLEKAENSIARNLARLVEKKKVSQADAEKYRSALRFSDDSSDLANAFLVIEAVPERMDLKLRVFRQLEEVCGENTILATNTSSLSVSVLAASCTHPERIVGMHFFNPAPVMKLVEVIVGEDTSEDTVACVVQLARSLGKEPIVCKDTPGFIVNRVARNFYGEALRIVGEGTATIQQVDTLMEQAAGFRMGPFTLMDLIGIDVNFDVTKAVYHAYHEEPKYRPHILQERLVQCGHLGRKSGRGFYKYTDSGERQGGDLPALPEVEAFDLKRVVVVGDTQLAASLQNALADRNAWSKAESGLTYLGALPDWDTLAVRWRSEEIEAFLRRTRPEVVFVSFSGSETYQRLLLKAVEQGVAPSTMLLTGLSGPSATVQASWLLEKRRVRGFSAMPDAFTESKSSIRSMEWSVPAQADVDPGRRDHMNSIVLAVARALDVRPIQIRDGAGGVMLRILSMMCNEAGEVLREGVATGEDIDTGMRLGTNYPRGPLEWLQHLGTPVVLRTLQALHKELGEDRYRPSLHLQHMALANV